MANKIQRARRVGGIAIGVVRTIFTAGRTWGTTRTRAATARRSQPSTHTGMTLAAGGAAGAAGAYFLDPQSGKRRRRVAFGRIMALLRRGAARQAAGAGDSDLANHVRTDDVPGQSAPTKETVDAGR
jgi:hypothetical protein